MPLLTRDSLITYILFILPLFALAVLAVWRFLFNPIDSMATKPSNHNLNGMNSCHPT